MGSFAQLTAGVACMGERCGVLYILMYVAHYEQATMRPSDVRYRILERSKCRKYYQTSGGVVPLFSFFQFAQVSQSPST